MLLFRKPVHKILINQLHQKSPCHLLCEQVYRIHRHKTLTINSIQQLPKQMTYQHACTLGGKPFSCQVDFITEEMQNIHWFQIL